MTVIFDNVNTWIEYHRVQLTLTNPAGFALIDTPTDRGGRIVGFAVTSSEVTSNDNTQAVGQVSLSAVSWQGGPNGPPLHGALCDNFRVFIDKQLGTAGNTTYDVGVLIFMQK